MAAFVKSNAYNFDLMQAKHNWATHTFKWMLSNQAASSTPALKADVTEIAPGNGYVAGGRALSVTLTNNAGVGKITIADDTLTAAGGPVGPWRTAWIYNDTVTGKPIVGCYDYLSSQTLADAEPLLIDFDQVLGFGSNA